jgi:hypothetical protein
MSKRARMWIGATLLTVLIFNYAAIGVPLYKNINSLEGRVKEIMSRQVKSGSIFRNNDDNYVVDVLKKEIINLDRKLVVLNCVAVSVAAVIISWMAFGLIGNRPDRRH